MSNIMLCAIGMRVEQVANPFTSYLRIKGNRRSEKERIPSETAAWIRVQHCEWELRKAKTVMCHSESDEIATKVEALVGKTVVGFSWHCKCIEEGPEHGGVLWAFITFSDGWDIVCYPYEQTASGDSEDGEAAFRVLFSIQAADKELMFLETGEVKCVDQINDGALGEAN